MQFQKSSVNFQLKTKGINLLLANICVVIITTSPVLLELSHVLLPVSTTNSYR